MIEFWKKFLFWFSASKPGIGFIKAFLEPVDPVLYRLTAGRFTTAGPVVIPQLILTTIGGKSGSERRVQLAYTEIGGALHIVASNFGGNVHPAWSYNLQANPQARVQVGARTFQVTAVQLSPTEQETIWDQLVANIPNYAIYQTRTKRNFKVYRLNEAQTPA